MPPPGYEEFRDAIRARPEDDTLRLAFAAWLDDHDDPDRAEFIRVQCRLAALGHGPLWPQARVNDNPDSPRGLTGEAAELKDREAELWAENGEGWLAELPELPGCQLLFHRGLPATVVVTGNPAVPNRDAAGLVRDGAALLEAAPVTRVTFRSCQPDAIEEVLSQPWFDAVRGLTIPRSGWQDPDEANRVAEVLAGAEHVAGLRDLSLFGLGLTGDGAEVLAEAAFFRRLVRVDLAQNAIGPSGALAVSAALDPARLVVLDLSGNPVPPALAALIRRKFGDRVCLDYEETDHSAGR